MKALIVDDARVMRASLRSILSQQGFECFEAADGLEAVARYAEVRPDLVTMDITMPGLDGMEALRRIRQADPQARVIMCSAMGQPARIAEAIRAGACDFIIKPFQPERVLEAVGKLRLMEA